VGGLGGTRGHPAAFGFAFELLDPDLRVLFVSAYQSYLWNRTLAELLRGLPDTFEVPYDAGRHVFYRSLAPDVHDRLCEMEIPLVAPGQAFEGASGEAIGRILSGEGVELRQFRLQRLRHTFFGKGRRPALAAPAALSAEEGEDEINRGRRKLSLRFELPRGSYATILLKRLFHEPLDAGEGEPRDWPRRP
jgi:tRNA pseudouridine13 synthase